MLLMVRTLDMSVPGWTDDTWKRFEKIPHTLDMSVIKGVKFKTKKRDDLL